MVISQVAVAHDKLTAHRAVFLAKWQEREHVKRMKWLNFDSWGGKIGVAHTYILLMYWSMQLLQNLWRQLPADFGSK